MVVGVRAQQECGRKGRKKLSDSLKVGKKRAINEKSGEGTVTGWEVQRQEHGRGWCPEVLPIFIFSARNSV